jgi:beta-glucosidase-like glycosyl hydrolase
MTKNAIVGISSTSLSADEITLLKEHNPYGIILFKRNCENETQVKELNRSIKNILPHSKIFIDQEGGRVARLLQPNFIEFPAAQTFKNQEEIYNNYYKMGCYLSSLGIDVNCAPVADLYYPEADKIIGDRSFGDNVENVAKCAEETANGLIASGVAPVIKHIPGHGRALVDSHLHLPIIETDLKTLEATDFAVFRRLNHLPMAMTAHIIYKALDEELPVTISKKAINYIREVINFKGILISDDLNMKALNGDLADLTLQSLEAGCNLVLHCSGKLPEMEKILSAIK